MALLNKQHSRQHFKWVKKKYSELKENKEKLDFSDVYPALREERGYGILFLMTKGHFPFRLEKSQEGGKDTNVTSSFWNRAQSS